MQAVVSHSYRLLFFHLYIFGQGKISHGRVYTIDNVLHKKVVLQANGRRLSAKNFDGENVDKLIKFVNIFPVKILRHTVVEKGTQATPCILKI